MACNWSVFVTGEGSGLGGQHCEVGCVVIRATGGGEECGGATSRGGCGGGPRGLKESAKPCLAAVWGSGGSTVEVRAREDSACTGT